MRIFGYSNTIHAVLGLLVAIVSITLFKLGVIGGLIGAIILAFSMKNTSIIIKGLIVGGFIILVFVVIPALLG